MSEPTKTVLWRGKHYTLVKSSGYSSYRMGSHTYTPGDVELKRLDSNLEPLRYATTLHELDTKPSKSEAATWEAKGITWGRLTPAIIAKLIEKATAADAAAPALIEEHKAKERAKAEASKRIEAEIHAAYEVKVADAAELYAAAKYYLDDDSIRGSALAQRLALLSLKLLNYTTCAGPCGRSLPAALFGYCCGHQEPGTRKSCGASVCGTCVRASEGLKRDDPKSLSPTNTLFCLKHAEATRAAKVTA